MRAKNNTVLNRRGNYCVRKIRRKACSAFQCQAHSFSHCFFFEKHKIRFFAPVRFRTDKRTFAYIKPQNRVFLQMSRRSQNKKLLHAALQVRIPQFNRTQNCMRLASVLQNRIQKLLQARAFRMIKNCIGISRFFNNAVCHK